jgi:hypothetical protein
MRCLLVVAVGLEEPNAHEPRWCSRNASI